MAPDGRADGFSLAFYNSLQPGIFLIAVIASCILVISIACRDKINGFSDNFGRDVATLSRSIGRSFREVFYTASPIVTVSFLTVLITAILLRSFYLNQPIQNDEAAAYLNYASIPIYLLPQ